MEPVLNDMKEFRKDKEQVKNFSLLDLEHVIADMKKHNIDIGRTIYKICPKCSEEHKNCYVHCRYRDAMYTCNIGVKVEKDGSYMKSPLQVIKYRFTGYQNMVLFALWNIQYFATENEARKALEEYDNIRNISDKDLRIAAYNEWVEERKAQINE